MDDTNGELSVKDKGDSKEPVKGAGVFGMWLFIVALGMLFAASMVGYLVVRLKAPEWPPAGTPGLPLGLYFSTFLIIGSSLTMHGALDSLRRNRQVLARWMLAATLALGTVFLVSQIGAWWTMAASRSSGDANLFTFTFYMLTALHAAHLLCGLAPLAVTCAKAFKGAYSPEWNLPVKLMGMYWHFLMIVWLVMFGVLIAGG